MDTPPLGIRRPHDPSRQPANPSNDITPEIPWSRLSKPSPDAARLLSYFHDHGELPKDVPKFLARKAAAARRVSERLDADSIWQEPLREILADLEAPPPTHPRPKK